MKRKKVTFLAASICAALLLCSFICPAAGAAWVLSTQEATGGTDSVYVAGNPDWYPIEYYNRDTKQYEGILPEILNRIGGHTGLTFTYVLAGGKDQRLRLAKNGQVELVSGYALDAEELQDYSMTASRVVLTIPQDGQEVEVCFAFTDIAGDALVDTVENALLELSDRETAGIAVRFVMENVRRPYPRWLLPAVLGALALLAAAVAILAVQRHKYKKAAAHDNQYDLMTGIGNKAYFAEQFEKYIPDQYRGIYSVLYIGFDIMQVNQYYGEMDAEEQLRFAAHELTKTLKSDSEIVARVSGGGFAVARPSSSEQESEKWTAELLARLNQYGDKYGKDYHPDFRAGIYMMQPTDRDCETVLYNAQRGYQQAVNSNKDYVFSNSKLLAHENEKLQLKKRTIEGIQNREFKLFLQFIVSAVDGTIIGAEALSRWDHPQKGLLYPGSYVELMESAGTIGELDFYIFEEACKLLEHWSKQDRKLSISCNFTRLTIEQENFVSKLQEIAGQYSFPHDRLVLEITEDTIEKNKSAAFENISSCKALGFRIALDDAGSGYTSFSDLRDYPIDVVKIDRSILNSAINQRGIALLNGMIALVHSLQMVVLCEGVETQQQADLLRNLGCDYMQGYCFYRVLPKEEVDRFLDMNKKKLT
ncbi:MAG: EAL domain-containing protein [Clostridiales bacterium]|nr:EAL domain-containing protein [Clostridiales bacterium]